MMIFNKDIINLQQIYKKGKEYECLLFGRTSELQ